jgi:hypothetical protein
MVKLVSIAAFKHFFLIFSKKSFLCGEQIRKNIPDHGAMWQLKLNDSVNEKTPHGWRGFAVNVPA